MKRHLAQLNIATLRHPIDDPRTADFVDALSSVNGAGELSPGYVWRLQSDAGDATDIQVFDDPMVIVNLTVWESLDALKAFAYRGVHRDFFRRRGEWFVPGASRTALWWVPAGVVPTTGDATRRLDFIDAFGPSPYAFEMGQIHPALAMERAVPDDARITQLVDDADLAGSSVVVAELDDRPAAFGSVRLVDDGAADICRIHVATSARGMRIGAAIVAELEAAARADGARRIVLETGPRQQPSLDKYEQFGFTQCPCRQPRDGSVCLEKSLVDGPRRLA